jgi:hypothetical protein
MASMATQLYDIPKDRTTQTGGQCNMLAWVQANDPTYLQMICRLADLDTAPLTERNNFWQGQRAELLLMIGVAEDEMWAALEATA